MEQAVIKLPAVSPGSFLDNFAELVAEKLIALK